MLPLALAYAALQAQRLHERRKLVLNPFQLRSTPEEVASVGPAFVQGHNPRMQVRASFVQVNPLRHHVARAVLVPEPAPGTVEECRPVLGRRLRPPLGRCCEQVFHDLDPIPAERFGALRLRVIEDSTDSRDSRPSAALGRAEGDVFGCFERVGPACVALSAVVPTDAGEGR